MLATDLARCHSKLDKMGTSIFIQKQVYLDYKNSVFLPTVYMEDDEYKRCSSLSCNIVLVLTRDLLWHDPCINDVPLIMRYGVGIISIIKKQSRNSTT